MVDVLRPYQSEMDREAAVEDVVLTDGILQLVEGCNSVDDLTCKRCPTLAKAYGIVLNTERKDRDKVYDNIQGLCPQGSESRMVSIIREWIKNPR